jgi:hypothetical protein
VWGSIVTGFIRLGGEICDVSICDLEPALWVFLGGAWPGFFKIGGRLGRGLERREDAAGVAGCLWTMTSVSEDGVFDFELAARSAGVDGRVHALDWVSGVAAGR